MSIANKLSYLEETKRLIKEKLNDLGAEITDDTFREYVEKLEEIYRNYPKTIFRGSDITLPIAKKEKIEIFPIGNTTQNEGASPDNPQPIKIVTGKNTVKIGGKNLWHPNVSFPLRPSSSSYNGTIDYDEETQVYTMNGTFGPEFFKIFLGAFDEFVAGDKILMKIEKISGTIDKSFMVGGYNNSGETINWVGVVSLSPSQTSNVEVETLTRDGMTYATIWTSFNNNTTTADNFKFRVLLAKTDDTTTPYEPYIEPIEKKLNLKSNNLFDKSKAIIGKEILRSPGGYTLSNNDLWFTTDYIPVESNDSYIKSGNNGQGVSIIFLDKNYNYVDTASSTSDFIVPNNDSIKYMITNVPLGCLDTFMVAKNQTEYEPYYNYELAKIGDYSDLIFKNERNNPNYDNTLVENVWYQKENNYKIVLTGNENISKYQYKNTNGVTIKEVMNGIETRAIGKCTHSIKIGDYYNDNAIWVGVNNSWMYWIGILDILGLETIEQFKNWLQEQYKNGTPVTIIYKTNNVSYIPITQPALIKQLNELYSMMTTGKTITIKTESEEENAQLNLEIRTLQV